MAKKEEQATKIKLERLTDCMGSFQSPKTTNQPKKKGPTFRTGEVAVLLIITTLISLLMGSAVAYKVIGFDEGEKVDAELQEFINNYQYIIDNYNGEVNKEEILDAALEGMLKSLDINSNYLDSIKANNFNIQLEGSYKGLGIEIYNNDNNDIEIYRVLENSPASKAGLKAGDVITKFGEEDLKGKKTSDFVKKVKQYKKDKIELTYIREEKETKITINMESVNLKSVTSKSFEENDKKIGYIGVGIFASNTYKQFKPVLEKLEKQNIDSLIIDLRSNSGGYLSVAEKMISLFMDSSHPIYQIQKDGITTKYYSTGNKNKKYKIIILVDENSASASEVMASALKEQQGATIVGKKTYGKGTVQEMQDLSSGDKFKLTTKNWLTSKGQWVDGKGLTPDVESVLEDKYYNEPTDANDSQLQKALEEAKK